jgi:hypothetical protein
MANDTNNLDFQIFGTTFPFFRTNKKSSNVKILEKEKYKLYWASDQYK